MDNDDDDGLGPNGVVGVGAVGEILVFLVYLGGVTVLPFLLHGVKGS